MHYKLAGIYAIHNIENDAVYIGSSINLRKRIIRHRSELKNGKHPNIYLQRAYNKYGKDNFEFRILFVFNKNFTEEELQKCELYFCNLVDAFNEKNYNLSTDTSRIDRNLCSIGGKIGGKIARDTGQINKIKTKDSTILGGKISGNKNRLSGQVAELGRKQGKINVESGLLDLARKRGVEVWSKEYIVIKSGKPVEEIKNLKRYCRDNNLPYNRLVHTVYNSNSKPINEIIIRKK